MVLGHQPPGRDQASSASTAPPARSAGHHARSQHFPRRRRPAAVRAHAARRWSSATPSTLPAAPASRAAVRGLLGGVPSTWPAASTVVPLHRQQPPPAALGASRRHARVRATTSPTPPTATAALYITDQPRRGRRARRIRRHDRLAQHLPARPAAEHGPQHGVRPSGQRRRCRPRREGRGPTTPLIVAAGQAVRPPVDGKFLMVYDAANGVEVKRIKLSHLHEADTVLGVPGDQVVVTRPTGSCA